MAKQIRHLKSRVYEFFSNLGSLTSIREQIDAMENNGVARYIAGAAYGFGLERPDEETISDLFDQNATGRDGHINRQIAELACWSRAIALTDQADAEDISLPALVGRIESALARENINDQLLERMDRAGLAVWDWFTNLEEGGISHMGQLVNLTEAEAFEKYFPEDYKDVEAVVKSTVQNQLHRADLSFDYWRTEGRKIPAQKL